MSSTENWTEYKLTQLRPLKGLTFRLRRYEAPNPEWDHDHCYGCWAKFAEVDASDILHVGYFTTVLAQQSPDPSITGLTCLKEPTPDGFALRWICGECFEEFREVLDFTVEPL